MDVSVPIGKAFHLYVAMQEKNDQEMEYEEKLRSGREDAAGQATAAEATYQVSDVLLAGQSLPAAAAALYKILHIKTGYGPCLSKGWSLRPEECLLGNNFFSDPG